MSDELEQLATAADQADQAATAPGGATGAAPGAAPGAAAAPPGPSANLAAIVFLLSTFRTVAGLVLGVQSLAITLDDAKVQACADVLAPVADKHGLHLEAMLGGPEGAAIMVAGPILWEAARQLHLELKAKRAKPVAPAPATSTSDQADAGALAGA